MTNIGTFNSLRALVKTILMTIPATRSDDFVLFANVVKEINPAIGNMPLNEVFLHHNDFKITSFASVTRARREVQKVNPELQADEVVKSNREELESAYRDRYATDPRGI